MCLEVVFRVQDKAGGGDGREAGAASPGFRWICLLLMTSAVSAACLVCDSFPEPRGVRTQ